MKRFIATLTLLAALAAALVGPTVGNADMMGETMEAKKGMKVNLKATEDEMGGYNLHVKTKEFKWTPQDANGKPKKTGGHAHLYIDGTKITRLYGPWFYLGSFYLAGLAPGEHEVEVGLNANNHAMFVHGEKPVEDSVTITTP